MSDVHPNIALIHRFFQAYGKNDHEEIREILSPDIKWVIPGTHPLSGTKTSVDEVLHYFAQLEKASFKAESIVMGVNDDFVIDCHRNWSNLENAENLDNKSCLLWKISDNKIIEVHNFPEDQHRVDAFFNSITL